MNKNILLHVKMKCVPGAHRVFMLTAALLGLISISSTNPAAARICNIKEFLDSCPTGDTASNVIRNDFTLRKDGVLVGTIACQEPISQLSISQYTDELVVLQALRTIYHLDEGQGGHLPWAPGTLYQWLKAKIGGINITSTGPDQCCLSTYGDGRVYFNIRAKDESNRNLLRQWNRLSEVIGLIMHERRHLDGTGFTHVGCCSVGPNGCDQKYDEANLSPYGIQWWLRRQWIEGGLYTGYSCLSAQETNEIKTFLRNIANQERDRYCEYPPPLLTDANNPVGICDQNCSSAPKPPSDLHLIE